MNRGAPSSDARSTGQPLVGVDLVFEAAHAAIEQAIDRVGLAGAQLPHIDRRRDRRDQHRRIGALDHVVLEQVRNRRPRRHEAAQKVRILRERARPQSCVRSPPGRRPTPSRRPMRGRRRAGRWPELRAVLRMKSSVNPSKRARAKRCKNVLSTRHRDHQLRGTARFDLHGLRRFSAAKLEHNSVIAGREVRGSSPASCRAAARRS